MRCPKSISLRIITLVQKISRFSTKAGGYRHDGKLGRTGETKFKIFGDNISRPSFQQYFQTSFPQGHICPLKSDHVSGLDCLTDEQALLLFIFSCPQLGIHPVTQSQSHPFQTYFKTLLQQPEQRKPNMLGLRCSGRQIFSTCFNALTYSISVALDPLEQREKRQIKFWAIYLAGSAFPLLSNLFSQVLPILLAMGPDDLLNCGRASDRLHQLVCDWQVWRMLVKRIPQFTDDKLEELVIFGSKGCSEMWQEILKEVAARSPFIEGQAQVKITLSIQGWGIADTVEVDGGCLEEINRVAEAVGAKFKIKEVIDLGKMKRSLNIFKLIAAKVDQQGEGLVKLEFGTVTLSHGHTQFCRPNNCNIQHWEIGELFFSLLKESKMWIAQMVAIYPCDRDACPWQEHNTWWPTQYSWDALAKFSANGHICTLFFPTLKRMGPVAKMDVKVVWEIVEKLTIKEFPGKAWKNIGGGRKEDPKTTWQEAYQDGLNCIC